MFSSVEVALAAEEFVSGNDQKTSADAAARGQTIGSRFCGEDCSVHRSCCPPRTSDCWAVVRFAKGGKEYAYKVPWLVMWRSDASRINY